MRSDDYPVRTGAQLLVDALLIQGVDTIFCVPGESYLSALRRASRREGGHPIDRLQARRRGGKYGGSIWKAHGDAWCLHCHPRARSCPRKRRGPYREAGFDTDDPLNWSG